MYGRTFRWILRTPRRVEAEAHHLHEIERVGASGETPFVAIIGIILFLLPIFLVMLGLALAAASLAG